MDELNNRSAEGWVVGQRPTKPYRRTLDRMEDQQHRRDRRRAPAGSSVFLSRSKISAGREPIELSLLIEVGT